MEARIRGVEGAKLSLLLIKIGGPRAADTQFGRVVAEELAGTFTKRLRNSLPSTAVISRGTEEEFLAILQGDQPEAAATAKQISENLTGAYACLKEWKTVRPAIHLRAGSWTPEAMKRTGYCKDSGVFERGVRALPQIRFS